MSQLYYALRMNADLNDGDTGKFAPHDIAKNSRQWYTSPTGDAPWTLLPDGNPDSDKPPILVYRPGHPKESDLVQFEVYFEDLGNRYITEVEVVASFGSQRRSQTNLASPFRRDNGNLRTILGLDGITRRNDPPHYLIGPYQVSLQRIPSELPPVHTDVFEFNLVAVFTLLNGSKIEVLEFGYDPEMEVETGSGPLPAEGYQGVE